MRAARLAGGSLRVWEVVPVAKVKGAHHRGSYQVQAKRVRDRANADPTTLCWRCGQPARRGDPWQAGHVVDGSVGGALRAEHASCNASAGATLGNRRRIGLNTTRAW